MPAFNAPRTAHGRGSPQLPAWVPTTAWEWTPIAGTVWTDYMKADGTGIAPDIRSSAGDPGPTWAYSAQWTYSAPTYSAANHEMYMFGGGHTETTINCLTRWNLSLDSPTVTIVSDATSIANRNAWLNGGAVSQGYELDGKPRSPHSYWNNQFSDSTNEFISFGVSTTATGYPTASGGSAGSTDIAACSRAGTWRAEDYYYDVQQTLSTNVRGPRVMSYDGMAIYYWDGADASDTATMRKWMIGTGSGAHTNVGTSVIPFYSRQAANSGGTALVLGGADSSAGWQAKFVDLSSGAVTAVTVTGSIASGLGIWDVTWCEDQGYWLCMWVNTAAANVSSGAGVAISSVLIATIEKTGANTATATTRTMSGTAPAQMYPLRGAFYDPTYGCVIVATNHSQALKAIKVAA